MIAVARRLRGRVVVNPLRHGWSREIISSNIAHLRRAGYRLNQAVSIAIAAARASYKRRYPRRRRLPAHLVLSNPTPQRGFKKEIRRGLEETAKRKHRELMASLRQQVRAELGNLKRQVAAQRKKCDEDKAKAYAKAQRKFARAGKSARAKAKAQTELRRQQRLADRAAARQKCRIAVAALQAESRVKVDGLRRRQREETAFRRELAGLEKAGRQRGKERQKRRRATQAERRQESDDAVRANIPEELWPVFEVVKGEIKASPRRARWEAFLEWVEENTEEVDVIRRETLPTDDEYASEYAAWAAA